MMILFPYNLSNSIQIFAFYTTVMFFIMFCYRSYKWLTKDETFLNKMIANSFEEEDENEDEYVYNNTSIEYDCTYYSDELIQTSKDNIFLEPSKNYFISIIYKCDSEISIIREQLVCLSHILSKQLNFRKERYEFICLVPPYINQLYDKLLNLSRSLTAIRPFLIDNLSDLEQFMFGGLNSKGKFIVDARYLVYELDFILSIRHRSDYVKCIRPENQLSSIVTRFLPIIATKRAVTTVFRQMHTTGIGSFAEFEFLCFNYKITFDVIPFNYIKIKHPIIESFYSSIIQKIIMSMYYFRYWAIPNLTYHESEFS